MMKYDTITERKQTTIAVKLAEEVSAPLPYLTIKNPVKVGIPTTTNVPRKLTRLDIKLTILNKPKFSKIIDKAVLAELK